MKTEQVRKLVSQAVIVGAVCVGAPALVCRDAGCE